MMPKTSVEAFTDAVIAIILTLLILELKIPEKADWSALTQSGHKIIIYLISFVTLLIYWNNHHHLFQSVRKIDGRVLWMNNLLILTLTFFPFVTGWVGEHPFSWPPQALYGLVVLGADVAYYLVVRALIQANGPKSEVQRLFGHYPKLTLSIVLNIIALIVGKLVAPIAVLIIDTIVLVMWFIPERKAEIKEILK